MQPLAILLATPNETRQIPMTDELTADGIEVTVRDRHDGALTQLDAIPGAIAVIDLDAPDHEGLRLVRAIRSGTGGVCCSTPILTLGGPGAEARQTLRALQQGADDHLPAGADYDELVMRLRALARRSAITHSPPTLACGPLRVDTLAREATVDGTVLELTRREYELLRTLAAAPTRVFTKAELLQQLWGYQSLGTTRTLDSHACRLRRKLHEHGSRLLVNVWGVGYRLSD